MHKKKRKMIKIMIRSITFLTLAVLTFFAYIYVKESPGGLADRMMSKALGMQDSILRIPNASTPEEAVEQFRGPSEATQIVHQEPVDGGMILFTHRTNTETSSNLQRHVCWVNLPVSENAPYTIKVYDEEGKQVGRKRVEMASDTGSLTLGKRPASM